MLREGASSQCAHSCSITFPPNTTRSLCILAQRKEDKIIFQKQKVILRAYDAYPTPALICNSRDPQKCGQKHKGEKSRWGERCEKEGWSKGGKKAGQEGAPEMQRLKESLGHEDVEEKQTRVRSQGTHRSISTQSECWGWGIWIMRRRERKGGSQPSAGASPYFQSQQATPSRG